MFDSTLDNERPFEHRAGMRRTYVRRRIAAAGVALFVVTLAVPAAALWAIAVRLAPDEDPREVVDRLVATNGVDAEILPGQELVLPDVD
jgi:hypothetical protein